MKCAAGVILLGLLAGCEAPAPHRVEWVLRFTEGPATDGTVIVEVCILEAECPIDPITCTDTARLRYRADVGFDGTAIVEVDAAAPPELPPGTYAFVGRARGASCTVLATGCTAAALPRTRVTVEMRDLEATTTDCCGAACATGICAASDAGPLCEEDGEFCTVAECAADGSCIQTPLPEGTPCPDVAEQCFVARCDSAGRCDQRYLPVRRGTPCAESDDNPCTIAACDGASGCVQRFDRVPDGDPCPRASRSYRWRCCTSTAGEARCVDILNNDNHCGGCGLACRGGEHCRERAGDYRDAACNCDTRSDCPDNDAWECRSGSGRCACVNAFSCRHGQGQHCTSEGFCRYPRI